MNTTFNLSSENEIEFRMLRRIAELEKANKVLHTEILRYKQKEDRKQSYNIILEEINQILSSVLKTETIEELGIVCLSAAINVTNSQIGFLAKLDADGLLNNIIISNTECKQCLEYNEIRHINPSDFVLQGLCSRIVDSGKGFFTNDLSLDPSSIGLSYDHTPFTSFLGVPLILDGKTMGMISVANRGGSYSYEQQEDLETIASAVTQALYRKREEQERKGAEEALYKAHEQIQLQSEELQIKSEKLQAQAEELKEANETLRSSEKRFKLLSEANTLLLSNRDPERIIQIIAEKVMHHLNCDVFFNYIFDEVQGRLRLNAFGGVSDEAAKEAEWLDIGAAICGCVARDGCRIISEDVQHNGDKRADLVRSMGIQVYSCQPLHVEGKIVGTLSFGVRSRKSFTGEDLDLMLTVADQISVAIERKQAEEVLHQTEKSLALELEAAQCLQRISTQLIQADNIETLYEQILDTAMIITHADFASVQIFYPERGTEGELRLLGYRGFNAQAAKFWEWVRPSSQSTCGIALRTRQRVIVSDVEKCDFMVGSDDLAIYLHTGIHAVQSTPLLSRSGALLGILSTHWCEPHKLTSSELRSLDVLARQAADLIEHKLVEATLYESESRRKIAEAIEVERGRLFEMLESLPVMICLLTPDYHFIFANRSFREKFGESGGRPCYECFGSTQPCEFCETYRVLETGQPHHWEFTCPDGSIIDAYDFPFTDFDGSPLILEMDIDITERRKAEEALAKIEKARQKEIHHRIKNNLQVISSLLDLQAEKFNNREHIENSEVLEAFRESQNRVLSIALIHKELHSGGETDKLNFSLYLRRLAESLFQTYRLENVDIRLNMDLEEKVLFDMDVAVPLGMIVNELITNSLKYAFPGKMKGEVQVKFFSQETGNKLSNKGELAGKGTRYTLIVSDNGVGIPDNIDLGNPDTLGLQLVSILVDQLDGEIKLKKGHGTELIIGLSL